jgi:hypothetical protein
MNIENGYWYFATLFSTFAGNPLLADHFECNRIRYLNSLYARAE